MGGLGSGRRSICSLTPVERCWSLDISVMKRRGVLKAGWRGIWRWPERGVPDIKIGLVVLENHVVLVYAITRGGGPRIDVTEYVDVVHLVCAYGGTRSYFRCPGCDKRILKLHLRWGRFRCRRCNELTYGCQRENRMQRLRRKGWKVRERLGSNSLTGEPFPPKPRGMHWKTYQRLHGATLASEEEVVRCMWVSLQKLRGKSLL